MAGSKKPFNRDKKAAPASRSISDLFQQVRKIRETQSTDQPLTTILQSLKITSPLIVESSERARIRKIIEWFQTQMKLTKSPEDYLLEFGHALSSAETQRTIKNFVSHGSLFSTERLLVILDAQVLKAAAVKQLTEIFNLSGPDVLTVIFTDEVKLSGTVFSLPPLTGRDRLAWLEREVTRIYPEIKLSPEIRQYLLQISDCTLDELFAAVTMSCLFALPSTELTVPHLHRFLSLHQQGSLFNLVERAAKGDIIGAQDLLGIELGTGSHPLQSLGFLAKAYRTMLAQVDGGHSAPSDLKNPWFLKQLGSARGRLNEQRLVDSISVLSRLDRELKDSKLQPEEAIKQAVSELSSPI